jgi:serine protease AprX
MLATRRQLPGGVEEVDAYASSQTGAPSGTSPPSRAPNDLIDPSTGDIDYARSSWSRSSWSTAPDALTAGWARSSWSCTCLTTQSAAADPTRSSWSRSSWSTKWTY